MYMGKPSLATEPRTDPGLATLKHQLQVGAASCPLRLLHSSSLEGSMPTPLPKQTPAESLETWVQRASICTCLQQHLDTYRDAKVMLRQPHPWQATASWD